MLKFFEWFLGLFRKEQVVRDSSAPRSTPLPDITSPSGMRVVAGANGPQQENLPESDDRMEIVWRSGSNKRYECGHEGAARFRLHTFGLETIEIDQVKQCPECMLARFKKHLIRCALCGLPIFPGEGVALYGGGGGLRTDIGTKVGGSYLGCLRWDCCPSGGFFAGHWTEQGFRSAFPAGGTAAGEAARTGEVVAGDI